MCNLRQIKEEENKLQKCRILIESALQNQCEPVVALKLHSIKLKLPTRSWNFSTFISVDSILGNRNQIICNTHLIDAWKWARVYGVDYRLFCCFLCARNSNQMRGYETKMPRNGHGSGCCVCVCVCSVHSQPPIKLQWNFFSSNKYNKLNLPIDWWIDYYIAIHDSFLCSDWWKEIHIDMCINRSFF